ncbi:MAG: hypothetical protein QW076_00350 [Candidatus Anstonellales archaeon]
MDIFSNPNYVQPSIIFQNDNIPNITNVTGFTLSSTGVLYALGQDSTPKAVVYYKSSPSGKTPSAWTSKFTSANPPAVQGYSPITAFITNESGAKEYLYYHTGTNSLSRYGNLNGTPTETASFVTLTGLTASSRLCHLVYNGELFIANGNYIARVSSQGNFTDKSFTLPTGLQAVDFVPIVLTSGGDYLAILCSDTNNPTQSQVVLWDMVATSGAIAKMRVPLAKPQWIQKMGTSYLIGGVNPNNQFEIYVMTGLLVSDTPLFIIPNIDYTLTRPVSPVSTKYSVTNTFLFGVEGINKSGIYAIGEPIEDQPAITLLHRCNTSYYGQHRPLALISINDAKYLSYYDGNENTYYVRIANGQSPTYSSQAILETLLFEGNSPYLDKSWDLFQIGTLPLPPLTSIKIEARRNTVDAYESINNVCDTVSIANTETQDIPIKGFNGKIIQFRLKFTSSGSSRPQLRWIGVKGTLNELF